MKIRILMIMIYFGLIASCLSCSQSNSRPKKIPTLPYGHIEIMKMPFDPRDTPLSGSISETLKEIPFERDAEHYWQVYEPRYAVTTKVTDFPPVSVDSAADWVFLSSQHQHSEFPGEGRIAPFQNLGMGKTIIPYEQDENYALYDGNQIKQYIFHIPGVTPIVVKTGTALSPKRGLFFGTSNFGLEMGHEGLQGICQLNEKGVVSRVFWPPSLRRWKGEIVFYAWDITDLEFSSPDRLWAGMIGSVVRLDLDQDRWILFDEYNSPIEDYVDHIATIGDSGQVRCVCREWRQRGSIQNLPKKGVAKIVRIAGEEAVSEPLSGEARQALNDIGPIVSDATGIIWFMGGDAIWRSDEEGTRKVCLLPFRPKYNLTCHFLVDSSGRFWVGEDDTVWVQKASAWANISEQMLEPRKFEIPKVSSLGEDAAGRIWVNWEYWPSMNGIGTYMLGKTARKRLEESLGSPPGNDE